MELDFRHEELQSLSDDVVMYQVKITECQKNYPHDFVACCWLHPGERARRRDPRTYNYSSTLCPEVKKDKVCARGDDCPYSHSLWEYFLHPDRYRTRMCDFGEHCTRKLCFFAHNASQLRVTAKSLAAQQAQANSGKGKGNKSSKRTPAGRSDSTSSTSSSVNSSTSYAAEPGAAAGSVLACGNPLDTPAAGAVASAAFAGQHMLSPAGTTGSSSALPCVQQQQQSPANIWGSPAANQHSAGVAAGSSSSLLPLAAAGGGGITTRSPNMAAPMSGYASRGVFGVDSSSSNMGSSLSGPLNGFMPGQDPAAIAGQGALRAPPPPPPPAGGAMNSRGLPVSAAAAAAANSSSGSAGRTALHAIGSPAPAHATAVEPGPTAGVLSSAGLQSFLAAGPQATGAGAIHGVQGRLLNSMMCNELTAAAAAAAAAGNSNALAVSVQGPVPLQLPVLTEASLQQQPGLCSSSTSSTVLMLPDSSAVYGGLEAQVEVLHPALLQQLALQQQQQQLLLPQASGVPATALSSRAACTSNMLAAAGSPAAATHQQQQLLLQQQQALLELQLAQHQQQQQAALLLQQQQQHQVSLQQGWVTSGTGLPQGVACLAPSAAAAGAPQVAPGMVGWPMMV